MNMRRFVFLTAASVVLCAFSFAQRSMPSSASPDASSTAAREASRRPNQRVTISPVSPSELAKPAGADWITYHGEYSGNHFSTLTQVDTRNVTKLHRAWVSDTDPAAVPAGRGGRGAGAGAGGGVGRAGAPGGAAAGAARAGGDFGFGTPVPPGQTGVGGGFANRGIFSAPLV